MKKKLSIAWCHDGVTGGAKRACYQMVRELSKRGHAIDEYIVSPYPKLAYLPLAQFIRKTCIIKLPKKSALDLRPYALDLLADEILEWQWERKYEKELIRAAGEINQGAYDLVHVDHFPGAFATGLLPYLKKKTILFCHEALGDRYQNNRSSVRSWNERMENWLERGRLNRRKKREFARISAAGQVLSNSVYTADLLLKHFAQRSLICYLGVDTEIFSPKAGAAENWVLSVGRLVDAKQHHLVIEAAALLPADKRPQVMMTTPESESSEGAKLEQLAREKKVSLKIIYAPSESELVNLYSRSACVVFVPKMEAFGLVPLEAMACGTPVIGIREGGVQETILAGVTGFLVDRDIRDISSAMEKILGRPEERMAMSHSCLNIVREQWTWDKSVDRYESYLTSILGGMA